VATTFFRDRPGDWWEPALGITSIHPLFLENQFERVSTQCCSEPQNHFSWNIVTWKIKVSERCLALRSYVATLLQFCCSSVADGCSNSVASLLQLSQWNPSSAIHRTIHRHSSSDEPTVMLIRSKRAHTMIDNSCHLPDTHLLH
jgi:hypothetical protein